MADKGIPIITNARVEAEALRYYQKHHTYASFPKIIRRLLRNSTPQDMSANVDGADRQSAEEISVIWSSLSDDEFLSLLDHLPINNIFRKDIHADAPIILDELRTYSISAAAIVPDGFVIYAFKYIPYIQEQMHIHDYFEINYVFRGEAKMIFENQTRILHEGDICVIAPGSRHDITQEPGNHVLSLILRRDTFESTFFRLLAREDLVADFFRSILYSKTESANYMLFSTDNHPDIRGAFKDLFMECYCYDAFSESCCISRIHLFFAMMLRHYGDRMEFYEKRGDRDHPDFVKLLHYIQEHYATLTLDELAGRFGYHPVYLSRLIHRKTGRTLTEIQTGLRMERACYLLVSTRLKIEEITEMIGFDSPDHFSRLFRKHYGQSPSTYRANSPGPH